MSTLNERAWELCDAMVADADSLGITVSTLECGTRIIDCGVNVRGSIEAGLQLARICMAGLASVEIGAPLSFDRDVEAIRVATDEPIAACMASQYAGWEIKGDHFFAMGSGPMRAAACREALFQEIGHCENADVCVGILEASKLPHDNICIDISSKCNVRPDRLTLLAARTASPAGTVQIVARSIETALHKLHVLGFEMHRVVYGKASAWMPPVADDDLTAIGWTNDAILYGTVVHLGVRGDDETLERLGPNVPSCASSDYGRPFKEIFNRYDNDFYRIDPMLFSPAVVQFINRDSGNQLEFGRFAADILKESFAKK